MRHPRVLVWEGDGRLAAQLRPLAEERRWALREPRKDDDVLRLLRGGGPAVVVIKAGRDLERELSLLERITRQCPDAAAILVADSDHARLTGLAWDLGASYVLTPSQPRDRLTEIVAAFLTAEGER
jgi:DNA-binding NarL/FixJ family response regulator